jgi:hypothetical protein
MGLIIFFPCDCYWRLATGNWLYRKMRLAAGNWLLAGYENDTGGRQLVTGWF